MFENWNYSEVESKLELPVGKYRIRVQSAEKAVSKSGNDMLVLKFEVSGSPKILWHYIVFLKDNPEITNRNLTQFFDSFGIDRGNFNLASYAGKVGGCQTKLDDEGRTKIQYFIGKKAQEELPAWQDSGNNGAADHSIKKLQDLTPSDDELPF